MRIVSVVGTRPQLIKAAALGPALRARHREVVGPAFALSYVLTY